MRSCFQKLGFTLIELLIVVAIIAILAAIAVPNFLEAQVRAKVARCRTDLRTIATALESYVIDHNKYPPDSVGAAYKMKQPGGVSMQWTYEGDVPTFFMWITTPTAYLTSWLIDPFRPQGQQMDSIGSGGAWGEGGDRAYRYYNGKAWDRDPGSSTNPGAGAGYFDSVVGPAGSDNAAWVAWGVEPDTVANPIFIDGVYFKDVWDAGNMPYDGTNGTKSIGDIHRWGP